MNERPNIVYLHAHDAGRYVEPYGFPVATPNLLAFAREGVLFRKAFAAAPTCGPSRAALLSGQYPHQVGVYGLPGRDGWRFDDYGKHLVHFLNGHGYETVLAGVQHECAHADLSPLAYRRILDARPQQGEFYQETIDHVERFLAAPGDRPFFLSVGIDEPHRDNLARPELGLTGTSHRFSKTRYYDPDRLDARYVAPPPFLPDLPEIRRDMAAYREGVRIMDEYMGRVLTCLRHRGLDGRTLVIVTSDHGIEFPGGKKTLSDQGIGVMLMIRGPGGFGGGRVIEPLVSQLDLFPTLCDLLGVGRPPHLEGDSLLPLVRGGRAALHAAVFAEQTYHGPLEPLRCIRTERHKLVLRHFPTGPQMRHDGPSTPPMEAAGWYGRPLGTAELFDLYLDPWEACNRAADPAYAAVRQQLAMELAAHLQRTGDPFVDGTFPPIPGRPSK